MKTNHYARKKRQLKALVEKLKYFMDTTNEDSLDQFKKLLAKIKNLVKELACVISIAGLKKILGAAAILIGISCANPAFAQSFGPPQTNPFGLVSTVPGSNPALADLDGDGDVDLLVGGGSGHIEYFENIGSASNPQFGAPQMNPFGLDSSYLYSYGVFSYAFPSFADLDDDGDMDLFIGGYIDGYINNDGQMRYFENIGDPLNPQFDAPQTNPFGLVGVGSSEQPAFADLDGDGDCDLLVTTRAWGGGIGLMYFENTGSSANPQFSAPQQNPFGLVPNSYSRGPSFADLDEDGDMDLLVGGDYSGNFNYFENIGDPFNPQFDVLQTNPFGLFGGLSADPAFADLDGDGDADLLVGSGNDVIYFKNTTVEGECPAGMTFTYQAQIDSLHAHHPNCTEIKGDVVINGSDITNLNGLNVITAIWGDFNIGSTIGGCNPVLTNLTGLQNLDSIGGNLSIFGNSALPSLSGLDNLTSIAGNLTIGGNNSPYGNPSLADISSLGNLDAGSINNLTIGYNTSLSACEVQSICDYLANPNGTVTINNNAPGCNSQQQVQEACEALHCLPEGITFTTQAEIDSFQINYPGCIEIEGNVEINGNDIDNLDSLYVVTAIGGHLYIHNNNALSSLNGLEGITSIGGSFKISDNDVLSDLSGLANVTQIGGGLYVYQNDALTNLSGLDNIDTASIDELYIVFNDSLSYCNVISVCNYLASPNATILIQENAPGCNSQQEVEDACWTSVDIISYDNKFNIVPNPLESNTLIEYTLNNNSHVTLKIIDLSGREMTTLVNEVKQRGEQRVVYNTVGLSAGVYFCVLKTNDPEYSGQTRKMIKL